jgi:hypothetical protein
MEIPISTAANAWFWATASLVRRLRPYVLRTRCRQPAAALDGSGGNDDTGALSGAQQQTIAGALLLQRGTAEGE